MRLVLRADGSSRIGLGHLSRVLALGRTARQAGLEVVLAATDPDDVVTRLASNSDIELCPLHAAIGSVADAQATAALLGEAPGAVVADGYSFGAPFLEMLAVHHCVAYVDDFARGGFPCDVVLNPNIGAERSWYPPDSTATYLCGWSFALLHERFADARSRRRLAPTDAPKRLLVVMGGADPPGTTFVVLDALRRTQPRGLEVRVVVGPANSRRGEIELATKQVTEHAVTIRTGVEDMASEALWCDLVITAAGVTATELACVGAPGIALATVDNQARVATELSSHGIFVVPEIDPMAIAHALDALLSNAELRVKQLAQQRAALDGRGTTRVVAALEDAIARRMRKRNGDNEHV